MKNVAVYAVVGILVYLAAVAFSGWVLMLLANIILEFFGVKTLTFAVACALSVLLSIIGTAFTRSKAK